MLQDKIFHLLFVFATIPYYNQRNIHIITKQEKGFAYIEQVFSFYNRTNRKKKLWWQIIFFCNSLFLFHTCYNTKSRRTTLVAYFNFFPGYFIKINNILAGLFTNGNYFIGLATGINKFSPVNFYINRVVLFGIAFRDKIMYSYN